MAIRGGCMAIRGDGMGPRGDSIGPREGSMGIRKGSLANRELRISVREDREAEAQGAVRNLERPCAKADAHPKSGLGSGLRSQGPDSEGG
jgi:hypothetical protein